ncbi:hypothetical protein C8J56DRAFT_946436 [Mycena floridula]|nr:hypothetical protein C8J56DRAFT_946436 [Mycena floridula]
MSLSSPCLPRYRRQSRSAQQNPSQVQRLPLPLSWSSLPFNVVWFAEWTLRERSTFHRGSASPSVGAVINHIEVHIFSKNHRESCLVLVARAFTHHWTLPKIRPTFLPCRSHQRCWWNLLVRIEGIQIQMGIYRRQIPIMLSNTDTRLHWYYPIASSSKAMQGR